jgi:rhamnosyltransferase
VTPLDLSVIVRARDAERTIRTCLELMAAQRMDGLTAETIVVDSGSTDRTAQIAAASGAHVLPMAAREFTFGRALNFGASKARGELLVALSADAFVLDRDWLARLVSYFSDERVACASGDRWSYDAQLLRGVIRQDLGLARRFPRWGYSNSAGAFRSELWRARPFREDLPGCEDQEWALHWLAQGYVCVVDPELAVEHDHTHDPLVSIYRRARREAEGFAMFLGASSGGLIREWWSPDPYYESRLRSLLSHRRAARLLGAHAGRRRAR